MPGAPRFRLADLFAFGLWVVAGALLVVAALIGPEGQCGYDNHDAYVTAAHRAGPVLLVSALAMASAGTLLAVVALRCSSGRAKIIRGGLAVASIAAACVTGLSGLLQLIALGCLE